jgi:hypothetical protein
MGDLACPKPWEKHGARHELLLLRSKKHEVLMDPEFAVKSPRQKHSIALIKWSMDGSSNPNMACKNARNHTTVTLLNKLSFDIEPVWATMQRHQVS